MFLRDDKSEKIYICLYVDDGIIAGDEMLMLRTVNDLKSVFNLKVQYGMKDFLGCEIEIQMDDGWIKQTRIMERLEKDWKQVIKKRKLIFQLERDTKLLDLQKKKN